MNHGPVRAANVRKEWVMNFIERLFGMAPDGGNGSTEALMLMGLVLVLVSLARRRRSVAFTEHPGE